MYRQENFANGRGAKTPLDKANRQSTDWEKPEYLICLTKDLYSEYIKHSYNSIDNSLKNGQETILWNKY